MKGKSHTDLDQDYKTAAINLAVVQIVSETRLYVAHIPITTTCTALVCAPFCTSNSTSPINFIQLFFMLATVLFFLLPLDKHNCMIIVCN